MSSSIGRGPLGQLLVQPGRREEFLEVVGRAKARNEGLGAQVRVRQTLFGGESSGQITIASLFESEEAHAEFTDKLRQTQDHPLMVMFQSADPPAMSVSRILAVEITPKPSGKIPAVKPVGTSNIFRPAAGHTDEVRAALAKAQELHESLGATFTVWRPLYAGSNAGTLNVLQSHDSFGARAQFAAKLRDANQGQVGPLGQLIRSGAITPVASSLTVEVDV